MRRATATIVLATSGCFTGLTVTREATLASDAVAPEFTLASQSGVQVSLAEAIAQGPVVLVFYRGHW